MMPGCASLCGGWRPHGYEATHGDPENTPARPPDPDVIAAGYVPSGGASKLMNPFRRPSWRRCSLALILAARQPLAPMRLSDDRLPAAVARKSP
jgi:hypothetical protein